MTGGSVLCNQTPSLPGQEKEAPRGTRSTRGRLLEGWASSAPATAQKPRFNCAQG